MYIIYELQKSNNGTVSIVPPVQKEDMNAAYQEYYSKLSYAAVSTVDVPTVKLEDDEGNIIEKKTFYHGQPQPEPEQPNH